MTLGQNIKERRKARGLNQTELAEKAGITQKTVSVLEAGDGDNIQLNNLRSIAKALGCLVVDLLPEEDKKKPRKTKTEADLENGI